MISDELLKKLNSIRPNVPQEQLVKKTYVYNDKSGGKYVGEVNEKGQWHGYGVYTDKVGRLYEGQHRNGIRHGYGIEINHQGSKYEGEWKDGECHGQGTSTLFDGTSM
jgi:hypothetical protein